MSLARVAVDIGQLILNHWATTPPHKAPQEGRFKTKGESVFALAPLQRPLLYITCVLEFLTIAHYHTTKSESTSSPFCPSSSHTGKLPYLFVTPITLFGISLIAFGTYLRLRCYEALGSLFTFDLCIKPEHRLITSGPYSFVRHPAYLGSLCLMAGLTFVGLTHGSWIIECGVGSHRNGAMFATQCAWVSWWVYTAGVGYARAVAEDEQMRNRFGEEWESYAMKVRYWFVPGLV